MLVKEGDLVRLDSKEKAEKLIFLSIFLAESQLAVIGKALLFLNWK